MYQAVILAAGKSSRFWPLNQRHKSCFYLMGKPIIWWNLKGIERAGIKKAIVIQSPRDAYQLLKPIGKYQKEHFIGLYLNARNQLIHQETISIGSLPVKPYLRTIGIGISRRYFSIL